MVKSYLKLIWISTLEGILLRTGCFTLILSNYLLIDLKCLTQHATVSLIEFLDLFVNYISSRIYFDGLTKKHRSTSSVGLEVKIFLFKRSKCKMALYSLVGILLPLYNLDSLSKWLGQISVRKSRIWSRVCVVFSLEHKNEQWRN